MKTKTAGWAVAFCFLAAASAFASPMMGKWKLNEARSRIAPGTGKNITVVYKSTLMGKVRVVVDGVDGKGKSTHNEWTGKFDGRDYPVTGDPNSETRSYKMVNDHTFDLELKKADRVVTKVHIVVAADGKTRTVTAHGSTPKGRKFTSTEVYDKE